MRIKCSKCNKFLAEIHSNKKFCMYAKNIEFKENEVVLKCRCGEIVTIKGEINENNSSKKGE